MLPDMLSSETGSLVETALRCAHGEPAWGCGVPAIKGLSQVPCYVCARRGSTGLMCSRNHRTITGATMCARPTGTRVMCSGNHRKKQHYDVYAAKQHGGDGERRVV